MTLPGLAAGIALAATVAVAPAAFAAEAYPAGKPITLVVPYPPGGSNDVFARAVGAKLGPLLHTTVVIENKPGAGGSIGASYVARAKPDGYTLAAVSSSFTTNAAIQANLSFDAVKDFTPVALMAEGPFIVAVKKDAPINSIADLVAYAKKHPGELNYASSGPGSSNQFATEMMDTAAGIKMTHVPFRGMGPATTALMAGQVDVLVASGPSLLPAINSGKVRSLGITSAKPSAIAPDLKPVADTVPGYDFSLWWGILAPAHTPEAIVNTLNAAIAKVVEDPEMKKFFIREGAESATLSAPQYKQRVKDDIVQWKKVAQQSNITVQK
jgi:tripartite-type tricarboxylate transporter receptor subunit TctC